MIQRILKNLALLSSDLAETLTIFTQIGLVVFLLMFLEWLWGGRTFGKRLLGLRVVDERGLRLRSRQVVMRNLFRLIDMMPAFFLVGGVAAALSSRCQRLGDLAAERWSSENSHGRTGLDRPRHGFRQLPQQPTHLEARLRHQVSPAEANLAWMPCCDATNSIPSRDCRFSKNWRTTFAKRCRSRRSYRGLSDERYVRAVAESLFRRRQK